MREIPRRRRSRAVRVFAAFFILAAACVRTSAGPDGKVSVSPTPEEIPTKWPIKHVVFIIKENRSFDHMFGRFPGTNGVTRGRLFHFFGPKYGTVDVVPLKPPPGQRYPTDLPHDYSQWVADYHDGAMDGFAPNPKVARSLLSYTQLRPADIPNYWEWAGRFVLADNFFASAVGPSFPNHLMSIAATSGGTRDNPSQKLSDIRKMQQQGLQKTWGCDIPKSGYITIYDSEGKPVEKVDPCFDFMTEGDLLRKKSIPWAYYAATPEQNGYIWSAYSAIGRYRNDLEMWDRYIKPVDDFEEDARAGKLPPVSWVTPQFAYSDHPEFNICYGENWTTQVINAVMDGPDWESTAIFLTWDDWGGFYDHARPKQVDAFGFGFRVPMLVISPYAKEGYIDHRRSEFSSVLRFIEDNWALRQLTERDRRADNMAYDFDFTQDPRPPEPLPLREDCQGEPFDRPGA